jgi:Heterokaryon incompatibility protein (HET)
MYNADLEKHPDYEAVSYVWGSEADKVPILCSGKSFQITQNLAAALLGFHNNLTSRTIWVDSICIDQNSIPERNHQVELMSQIYRKASHVLIWLGEEEFMNEAMECIVLLHDRVAPRMDELQQYEERTIPPSNQRPNSEELTAKFDIPSADSGIYESLNKLFRSAWFSRAWTFQESFLANASTFHFGTNQVTGDDMLSTFIMLYHLNWAGLGEGQFKFRHDRVIPMLATSNKFPLNSAAEEQSDFMQLLDARRGSGCKNPSDILYSLLGVAPMDMDIKPDYSKPFEQVFAEFASARMEITASLAILGEVVRSSEASECPTWVPDWRIPAPVARTGFTDRKVRRYSCTGSSRPLIRISSDWKELTIQGFRCNQIIAVAEPFSVNTHPRISQRIREMDEAEGLVAQDGDTHPLNTMLRVLCADLSVYDEENPNSRWNSTSYHWYLQEMVAEAESGGNSKKRKLAYIVGRNALAKYIILTSDQTLGLAPDISEPGDVIALLLGGEVPIVLRPKNGKYIFIGECFVDGMMDGEGLVEARKRARPDEDHSDTSWLNCLHREPLPFDTESFVIL